MKLYKDGIVRDVSAERVGAMKKQGWMEIDKDGNPISSLSKDKDIEIAILKEEIETLKKEDINLTDGVMEVLKKYANLKGIDYGSASTAQGVLGKIVDSEKE